MTSHRAKATGCGEAKQSRGNGEKSVSVTTRFFNVHKVWRSYRKKRGAAAVEFAIVAPLFFLLLFGMIEYGRCVLVQQVLTNASREGARRAVLDGTDTLDVENVVEGYLTNASITGATVTVAPDPPGDALFGEPVTVTVQVPFSQVSWLPAPMFLGNTMMTATSVMRREAMQ
jgi:Flp pilus assembly protein TadG